MPQWGKNDNSSNSTLWGITEFNKQPLRSNQANFYGNTTTSSYVPGLKVGQFGVDSTEIGIITGGLVSIDVVKPGSGYSANATVTVGGNGTANATANSIGRVSAVNIVLSGNTYNISPPITVAPPAAQSFNALTAVANTTDFITISTNVFQNNDKVQYLVATGNTAIGGLANAGYYYVTGANTTGVTLAPNPGGAVINITASVSETGHSLTGETALAIATIGGGKNKGIAHAGWNLRRAGTGGRDGRVHYETLVAMGTLTGDGSDDTVLPDS